MSAISSYLLPGRLADVLALIQVLAYDYETYRSEDGLKHELQRPPTHGSTWMEVGLQHPEFFRVRVEENRTQRMALLCRYVLPHEKTSKGEDKRPPLEITTVNKLMELAIQLHAKQEERFMRWKSVVIPVGVALVAASASLTAAFIGLAKPAGPVQTPPAVSRTP